MSPKSAFDSQLSFHNESQSAGLRGAELLRDQPGAADGVLLRRRRPRLTLHDAARRRQDQAAGTGYGEKQYLTVPYSYKLVCLFAKPSSSRFAL